MVAEWTLSGKEAVLRTKVAVEQNREFGAYTIAKVLGFLSAGTVNFLLLEKEEKKFTAPADFFLHSFGEVC